MQARPASRLNRRGKTGSLLLSHDCLIGTSTHDPAAEALRQAAQRKAQHWVKQGRRAQNEFVRAVLKKVVVGETTLEVQVSKQSFIDALIDFNSGSRVVAGGRTGDERDTVKLTCEIQVNRRGNEVRLILPGGPQGAHAGRAVPSLIKAIARAHAWQGRIVAGDLQSIETLAAETGLTQSYVSRILQCATLAPKIVESILQGRQGEALTLKKLIADLPLIWSAQTVRLQADR